VCRWRGSLTVPPRGASAATGLGTPVRRQTVVKAAESLEGNGQSRVAGRGGPTWAKLAVVMRKVGRRRYDLAWIGRLGGGGEKVRHWATLTDGEDDEQGLRRAVCTEGSYCGAGVGKDGVGDGDEIWRCFNILMPIFARRRQF
jgi:hypothetical protein